MSIDSNTLLMLRCVVSSEVLAVRFARFPTLAGNPAAVEEEAGAALDVANRLVRMAALSNPLYYAELTQATNPTADLFSDLNAAEAAAVNADATSVAAEAAAQLEAGT